MDRDLLRAAVLCVLLAAASVGFGADDLRLDLRDGQGAPLSSRVEVCFQQRSAEECQQIEPRGTASVPGEYLMVRIEGDDYGPVHLRRRELQGTGGGLLARVPRKSALVLEGAGSAPVSVSLYDVKSSDFRQPVFRRDLPAGAGRLKVPQGSFVLSLSRPGQAPDLHRIAVRDGLESRARYRPVPGWSLLLRCLTVGAKPVGGAEVDLFDAKGFGFEEQRIGQGACGADGIALFSGITAPLVAAEAKRSGLLSGRVDGITASRDTFAFKEIELPIGGQAAATVSQAARPVPGAACLLAAAGAGSWEPFREVWRGFTDRAGRCRSTPQREGSYRLQVALEGSRALSTRWIRLIEGEEASAEVALAPSKIRGRVLRGAAGASGYAVEAAYLSNVRPAGAPADIASKALSGSDGSFELTVWDPGEYFLLLRAPEGSYVSGRKKIGVAGDDEKRVDFELGARRVRGVVVDFGGKPVEGATVLMEGAAEGGQSSRAAFTGPRGAFSFELSGEAAPVRLRAGKPGFRDSGELVVPPGGDAAPPVRIVLRKAPGVTGVVVGASGAPVSGALLTALAQTADGPEAYRSARSKTDGAFVLDLPAAPAGGFVSGNGCPLTPFDLEGAPAGGVRRVACAGEPATVVVSVRDEAGKPLQNLGLILKTGSALVPEGVLRAHLEALGVPAATDGSGRIALVGLAPGTYEIYSSAQTSTGLVAARPDQGLLTSVSVGPLETVEVRVTVP